MPGLRQDEEGCIMTVTSSPAQPAVGRIPVFDHCGRIVATVGASRSRWLGVLLAECSEGHVYLLDDEERWFDTHTCPVCEAG